MFFCRKKFQELGYPERAESNRNNIKNVSSISGQHQWQLSTFVNETKISQILAWNFTIQLFWIHTTTSERKKIHWMDTQHNNNVVEVYACSPFLGAISLNCLRVFSTFSGLMKMCQYCQVVVIELCVGGWCPTAFSLNANFVCKVHVCTLSNIACVWINFKSWYKIKQFKARNRHLFVR